MELLLTMCATNWFEGFLKLHCNASMTKFIVSMIFLNFVEREEKNNNLSNYKSKNKNLFN